MWFPTPLSVEDIELAQDTAGALSVQQILARLTAPGASEWRNKVGVSSPADGSAKTTTRLLESGGWVFKTDLAQRSSQPAEITARLEHLRQVAQSVPLWHPQKLWFSIRLDDFWLPMSACPTLQTLRQVETLTERQQGWLNMLQFGWEVSAGHQLGLDLNPSNFGWDSEHRRLYYIDDELYGQTSLSDLAEAIVSRIPEERDTAPQVWRHWGQQLQQMLLSLLRGMDEWVQFLDSVSYYPLVSTYHAHQKALLQGLREGNDVLRGNRSRRVSRPQRTCIFSDIHSNLPALDAVLRETRAMQVDSYLFLGDVVGYGPFPSECIQRLAELPQGIFLQGNHDQMIATGDIAESNNRLARESALWSRQQLTADELAWLAALPDHHQEESWLAVHGAPQDPRRMYAYIYEMTYQENLQYLAKQQLAVCFYGHTHVPFIYRLTAEEVYDKLQPRPLSLFQPHEVILLNPGSVGQPRDRDPRASFATWDRKSNRITFHRVSYPLQETTDAILREGLPEDLTFRLEMGW